MKVKFTNQLKKLKIVEQLKNLDGYLNTSEYHDVERLSSTIGCDIRDLLEVLIELNCEFLDTNTLDE